MSPGFKRLTSHPDYQAMVERTLAEQARAISEVAHMRVTGRDRAPQPDNYPTPSSKVTKMPKRNLQARYADALMRQGEVLVKKTFRYLVFSRKAGGHYYLGAAGSLRFGATVARSKPVSRARKVLLIESLPVIEDQTATRPADGKIDWGTGK